METELDRLRLQTANRFGQLSKNMFFARHVPHPRFLKFITGTAGVQVCHVRDNVPHIANQPTGDLAKSLLTDPRFNIDFPPNSYNETLLRSYAEKIQPKKRRERFLPPLRGWNPSGAVVEDTENWRHELSRIAEMVGLVTTEELQEIQDKKEKPRTPATSSLKRSQSMSGNGEYSQRTGRWNETPKTISRSRSLRRRTPLSAILPTHLFCVDEQEREVWMLQVLCQILKTESINDVQSWLVSSSPSEKDTVRQLITTAIKGLEENGRIQPTAYFDETAKSLQVTADTVSSLVANKFPSVSSSQVISSTNDNTLKPIPRPRTSPQIQQIKDLENQSYQSLPINNLHPILEESSTKSDTIQPTKADSKRDIQVLTLNDNASQKHEKPIQGQDEVPF